MDAACVRLAVNSAFPTSGFVPSPGRRSFLLRVDPELLEAVQRWADDDLRSLNGQIEFLLRRALRSSGRAIGGKPDGGRKQEKGDEWSGYRYTL